MPMAPSYTSVAMIAFVEEVCGRMGGWAVYGFDVQVERTQNRFLKFVRV